MRLRLSLPFVSRAKYDAVRAENYTLRDALREANAELRRHRMLIADLSKMESRVTAAFERAVARQ